MFLNFDKLNHLFGGPEEEEEEEKVDVTPYKEAQQGLLDELKGMDEQLQTSRREQYESIGSALPEDPGYEYISYAGASEDEITADVTASYREAFKKQAEDMEREYSRERGDLLKAKEETASRAEEEINAAREQSAAEKKSALEGIAANGMGRSSVYELAGRAYDDALAREEEEIGGNIATQLAEEDEKLADLQAEYLSAVKKADVENALELAERIEKLQTQRRKEEQAVEKYNNDVTNSILDYKEDREKTISDEKQAYIRRLQQMKEYEDSIQDYVGDARENYLGRLSAAVDFYKQYPAGVQRQLISDNSAALREYLGYYYDDLLDELNIS